MFDVRMFWRSTGVRSLRSRGRWTTTAVEGACRDRWSSITSIGSSSGRGMPQRCAADRCDAAAPWPAARTAAAIGLLSRGGGSRAAGRLRVHLDEDARRRALRYHDDRDTPCRWAAARVTSPWCSWARSSSRRRSTPRLGVASPPEGNALDLGGDRPGFRDGSPPR